MNLRSFQYVIVGTGVAATTVAKKLLEKNATASILMLEAGPRIPGKDRRGWWDYVLNDATPYSKTYDDESSESFSVGPTPWGFRESRVRAYGGSTMHWGGWSLRYKPEDFELFSRTGEGGDWCFSYADFEPYYSEAEEYLAVCGDASENWSPRSKPYPLPPYWWTEADGEMIRAFEANGIKPGKMPVARHRKCMTTGTCKYCPFGSRFSAQYVLDELVADPRHTGLEVKTESPAVRIIAEGRQRAAAVEYKDLKTGQLEIAQGEKIILCAGAYETPKLLLSSRSRFWEHGIGNDHDLVGRYAVTHSMLLVRGRKESNPERWVQQYDFPTLMSRSWDTPENQKNGKVFLFPNRALPNLDLAAEAIAGKTREEIERKLVGPREVELQGFMEEKGQYTNRVLLAPGTGKFGLPRTMVEYTRPAGVAEVAANYMKRMGKILESIGYTVTSTTLQNPRGDHTTGTCRMGKSPDVSVTDGDLKVHGVENLFLCSNAVMPSSAAVNPTLTVTALALRLGDHLHGL